MEFRGGSGKVLRVHDHVAPADIEVMFEYQGDGLGAEGLLQRAVQGPDLLDRGTEAAWEHHDFLADPDDSARDLPTEAAEVMESMVGRVVGSVYPLDRHPEVGKVPVASDMDGLEVAEKRRSRVPRGMLGSGDDVVAVESAHRDKLHILDVEPWEEFFKLVLDLKEALLAPADQIHLVDGDHKVGNTQKGGDNRMAATLLDDSLTRVDQDDR